MLDNTQQAPICYLVSQYPKPTHTFIRREILALERLGLRIERVSIRRWEEAFVDPLDESEDKKTTYVLAKGALALLRAVLSAAIASPSRFMKAALEAVKLWRLSGRGLHIHIAYLVEACWLSEHIKAIGATHLHAHFGTNPAAVAMLTHVLSDIPYSFTVHGYDEFDNPVALGLEQKIALAKFVVGISSYGRSQLMRWARVSDWSKIQVIRCGIDEAFYNCPQSLPAKNNQFVLIGRLCKEKAQLIALEALSKLKTEGKSVKLVLVGDGDLRSEVEAEIAKLGLTDEVHLTGWVGSTGVLQQISNSIALLHPSFADGLPVAVMEAFALQRPVIACYVAGTPELVAPGLNGWLTPASDVDALADAMRQCLNTPETQRMQMGKHGRECVLAKHNADREAHKLALLFTEKLIETSKAVPENA